MKAGLDIGNTRSKLGLFQNEEIKVVQIDRTASALLEAVHKYDIQDLIVTSVTRQLIEDENLMKRLESFLWLSDVTPLPIELNYDTPETLGRDRIATAVGASMAFPEEDVIVIDAGTCMTVDLVTMDKIFQGGYIAPGISLRWRAMNSFTANLPLVDSTPEAIVGKSTKEALGIGGAMGAVLELEGYIARMRDQYPSINVILTGGDGTFILNNSVSKMNLRPNLLMEGLREIQKYNAE